MNVCNMEKIGTINIHKHDGKYYLNIIAHDDVAEGLNISDGLWTNFEIPKSLFESLLDTISQADYYRTRGHEIDYVCAINGIDRLRDSTTII